jgi:hypothetical protein
MSEHHERSRDLFKARLQHALRVARNGEVAIVIVPYPSMKQDVLAFLGQSLDRERDHNARVTPDALHFEGTRGSVRIYPSEHITYDRRLQRLLDYPATIQHFLHPEVEGL